MSWLEDAQRGNECLPCWHPLKSGGRGKLFQLGAQLRPCPFGAPPTGTGLSRPKLELCSHAVVLLPFHPWEWYITTNQAKRRANPCEPALSVAIATGYRESRICHTKQKIVPALRLAVIQPLSGDWTIVPPARMAIRTRTIRWIWAIMQSVKMCRRILFLSRFIMWMPRQATTIPVTVHREAHGKP